MHLFILPLWILFGFAQSSFKEISSERLPADALRNNSMDIEYGDLDKDGDMDLVIAMEFRPNVLLLNDGTGKMVDASAGRLPRKNHDSEDIAVGDFDQDGDLDIIFVSEDDKTHEYYLNDGRGYFSDASDRFLFTAISNAVDAADFDQDGDLDLIMGNDGQDFFLLNDGKGNFTNESSKRLPADVTVTQDVQSADLDGDGDLDLIMGNEDGNRLYLNNGKGFFTDATSERLPLANEETRKARLADVDADGDLDLFFCNVDFGKNKDRSNRLLINNGKGIFKDESKSRLLGELNLHTGDAVFLDLDGDKDLDLVLANLFGGYGQVFENDGKGTFKEVTNQYFSSRFTGDAISVEAVDLDKNKFPELYFGMFRGTDRLFGISK